MEVLTVRGLVLLLAVVYPALGLLFPTICVSEGQKYHIGETWVQNCRQCECHIGLLAIPFSDCGEIDVCATNAPGGGATLPPGGGGTITPGGGGTLTPGELGPMLDHCSEVEDCHRYFDFCRTRLESTDCVHGTCQCIPDPSQPVQGNASFCRTVSDCVSTAVVCQTLFEDAFCFFGHCQCVPKGKVQDHYNGCFHYNDCDGLSPLCQGQHGEPLCYHGICLCAAKEPCVYGGRTYEQHEVWTDKELCKSCVCSDTGTALCLPLSNSSSCSLHGNTTTMAVPTSASAEPKTTIETDTGDTTPVITFISPNVTVSRGDNFTLACDASGVPPPVITWGHIDRFGFPENVQNFSNLKADRGILHVTGATNQQAGTFVCRARNAAGHADAQVYVTVLP